MKFSRKIKKLLACICAVALATSGLMVNTASVNAQNADTAAASYDWSAVEYLAGDVSGQYKIVVAEGSASIVNVQKPGFAAEVGIYTTYADADFGEMTVNGAELGKSVQGAGIILHLSNFIYKYSEVVVKSSNGSVKAKLYVYNDKGAENTGGGVEVTTEAPTTTTAADPTQWADASDTWTTDGVWNIWVNPASGTKYKNNNTLDDYYVSITQGVGDWSVQTNTIVSGLTAGTLYSYKITIESDKEGAYVGAKDDISNSSLTYKVLSAGSNVIEGTFTAAGTDAKMFLEMGNVANSGATFHITGVEVAEYTSETTVEYGKNIVENGKWLGWFEAEGWASYTISEVGTGYTLTDKGIGANWYSIQTGIDNVEFLEGIDYVCEFVLTASEPKQFKFDNRSNDATIFTEEAGGTWTANGDGTYSYKYKGTFTSDLHQFLNVRIALGYFSGEENYAANDVASFKVSDFTIYAVKDEETTTAPVETTTEEVTTEVPTTEESAADPIEVIGQGIIGQDGLKVTFVWGQTAEQIELGQTYNVYIDGEFYQSYAGATAVEYEFATAGDHTIVIKAALGEKETEGVTINVTVEGEAPTEAPTTEAPKATYTVSVDGVEFATVEEGSTVTFPSDANVGYYGDGKLYKAGSTYTVTKDVEFATVNITVTNGASIRFAVPTGIRFQASIASSDTGVFDSAIQSEGMLIAPKDVYDANGGILDITSDYTKINVTNNGWYLNTPGSYCASLVNINEYNYVRSFVARAYVTVEYADGSVETIYSGTTDDKSIKGVASALKLSDAYSTLTAEYQAMVDTFAAAN